MSASGFTYATQDAGVLGFVWLVVSDFWTHPIVVYGGFLTVTGFADGVWVLNIRVGDSSLLHDIRGRLLRQAAMIFAVGLSLIAIAVLIELVRL